ncbi:MAG: phage shock protein PspA [Rhodobacterales bacterium]|nr:phage shock protein PspA [Rhodobacterales bacterium]
MGVFSRLSDIINSNVNSILDKAEEPEKIVRLIIQEMEDTLVEVRTSTAKTIAERKEVERKLRRIREAQAEWQRKAEIALAKDREDLSRAALVEKAKLEDSAKALEQELDILDGNLVKGEADIVKLQEKLVEAKAKQKTLQARHDTASNRTRVRQHLYDGRIEEAFARFEQVEKRLDEAESKVEVYDLGRTRSLADEIADLEAEANIESELAAMKARLNKGSDTGGAGA